MAADGLTVDQLRVFLAVVDEGGFSAAARRLGRAQSAVSYAVANLEAQLGVALFSREDGRPTLTEQGRALLGEAASVTRGVAALRARARAMAGGLEPELTLVVDVLYPLDELAAGLTALAEVFPTVPLRLRVESLGAVAKAVLDRTCRLGIMGSLPILPKGLERTPIGEVQLVAVTAPSHPLSGTQPPITSEMVANHVQLVLTDRSELTQKRDFAVLSPETWRVADLGAKHALLRQGFGWGYMPWPVVEKDLARGTLTELSLQNILPRGGLLPLYAVYPQDEPPGPAGAWLVQRLRHNGRKRET